MEAETLNNEGIVAQEMNVSSGAQVAGRDIHNYENHFTQAVTSGFASVNTEAYNDNYYLSPMFTGALAEQAKDRKLVILAGGQGLDKGTFVRHLAARISEDVKDTRVMEWIESESNDNLQKEIREADRKCIFILNNATPKHLSYDPNAIAQIVSQRGHILLVTTDLPQATWQLPEHIRKIYWYDVPLTGLYSKEMLGAWFIQRIQQSRKVFGLSPETEINNNTALAGKYSISVVASRFDTPAQVDFFISLLEAEEGPIDEERTSNALATVTDTGNTLVTKWYLTLSPSEKLIALGAAMLDGLLDDQFFAVMQKVVDDFWHHRELRLRSLDYCDIDFLLSFFKFEVYEDGRQVLTGKFQNQRAEIIQAAWNGHKRHILSAFNVLTSLAGSSGKAKHSGHQDIAGTISRGMKLRTTVADTISDIGIVSLQTAEPKLLELASSGEETIRRVTAKAIARWRAFRKDEQMFEVLDRWKSAGSGSIRSSVILTLRYAAEYDSPGCLDPRLMDILGQMTDDDQVTGTMKELLPRLIKQHNTHIQEWIAKYFGTRKQYTGVLTKVMVELYAEQPHAVKQMVDHWLGICALDSSKDNRRKELTHRDTLHTLVLSIFREIPYSGDDDAISIDHVWSVLQASHDSEQRRSLRAFLFGTIAFIAGANPGKALQFLAPIFKAVGTDDRLLVIEGIGEAYLHQRERLTGGEYEVMIKERNIPVWHSAPRPLTDIEKTMYQWLLGNDPFARELATLSFVRFARILDHEEPALITKAFSESMTRQQEELVKKQREMAQQANETVTRYPEMPDLSLWTRIKIFFWLLFKDESDKIVLREVMTTLLMYRETNPQYINSIISRLTRNSQPRAHLIAWWLGKITGSITSVR